jgi:hypothetical protein
MSSFGFSTVDTVGRSIQVSADGKPEFKTAGVTIDWSLVLAVSGSDVTLLDGVVVHVGEKYMRYGQVITRVTASGKFAQYDFAAADGRQLVVNGDCFILNETVRELDVASDHPPALEGGKVFLNRIIQSGVATHSLALGPNFAELMAAMPRLRLVRET